MLRVNRNLVKKLPLFNRWRDERLVNCKQMVIGIATESSGRGRLLSRQTTREEGLFCNELNSYNVNDLPLL
jgi:hypothetical protein